METVRTCSRCIMDTLDDPDIRFDEQGVCSYCHKFEKISPIRMPGKETARIKLDELVSEIKSRGKGKIYDCLLGVSGGVDSTYTAVLLKQLGLKPLLVHLDNGWNSETAVRNITNMSQKLGLDLYTYVINWEEFRDIQLSFLRASVVDIELLTDYAIVACLYNTAAEKNIRYIISGHNFATESVMPDHWVHHKGDLKNILGIHEQFGKTRVKTFPMMSYYKKAWYVQWKKIKVIPILNVAGYNKTEARQLVEKELAWQDYGLKHGESVFTKFYQNYILPVKFGIDKRKAHLSSLICSGQITRTEALAEMQKPLYSEKELGEDINYVIKKFNLSRESFEAIMNTPPRPHLDFPSYVNSEYNWERKWLKRLKPFTKYLKKYLGLKVESNYV